MENVKRKNLNKKKNVLILNNTKGITLVALVITIIVLIILAGVSTSLLVEENGIINKAKEGKQNIEQAKVEEETMLNEVAEYMENLTPKVDANGVEPGKSGYLGSGYNDPYIPVGFEHIGTADWNSGYQIKETATENIFVWVPCVTDANKIKSGDNVQIFKRTLPTTSSTTDPYYSYNSHNITITGEKNPASEIKESVGKYEGFYIAAYETGIEGTTENYWLSTSTPTDGSVKPLSKAGCGVWNDITRTNALTVASSMVSTTDGVKSGLISGECWDTTLQWMVNSSTNKEINKGYDINSTGKGWYRDVSSGKINTTGYYAVNNIYDMAGNVCEWTTENSLNTGYAAVVYRGGLYTDSGSDSNCPAAYRYLNTNKADNFIGFRVVLYK